MSKASVARPYDPLESRIVCALSEARAAHWILNSLNGGNLGASLRDTDTEGWVMNWSIDALGRALDETERAFRKIQAARPAAPQAVA